MINNKSMAKRAAQVGIISALTLSVVFSASADDKAYKIDVADIPLNEALIQFTIQSQWQFLSPQKLLKGKKATAVKGTMSRGEALKQLLKGTGLDYIIDDKGQILIVPAHSKDISSINSKDKNIQFASASYMSDASTLASENRLTKENNSASDETEEYMEEVTTTGSHIRGVGAVGSKVITVDREEIDLQGYSTVTEFIQSLPQNFNGGVSESTTGLSFENGAGAINQGTGINLRGLGNVSTLVLLNGQRLAPSGLNGGFVDISMIPLSAVERVEVLTDGASAIYGSDAIGGVVNFKLRKDYDGAETRLRYGLATQGGLEEITVGQTFGKVWDQAHGLISFEYNHRNPLNVKDRSFSQEANEFIELLPEQERHNVFLTGGFNLTDNVEVFTTAYYNLRNSQQTRINSILTPPKFYKSKNQNYGGTFGSTWDLDTLLGNEWQMELVGSFSRSESFTRLKDLDQSDSNGTIFNRVTESLSTDAKFNGSLFDMSGGDAKLAIGGHFRHDKFGDGDLDMSINPSRFQTVDDQSRDIYALFGEIYLPFVGADNRMPGVERLEISISARYEHYSDFGTTTDPKFGVVWSPINGLNLRGTYGTSFRAPLLTELDEAGNVVFLSGFEDGMSPSGRSFLLLASGNNSDLQPETATIWTVGFDFQHDVFPGFNVSATYFNINYKDRINSPNYSFFSAPNDPSNAPFVNFDGPDANFLALIEDFVQSNLTFIPGLGPFTDFSDADVTLSADIRVQNLSRNNITGLDFSVSYALDTVDAGSWNFSASGTYIFDYIVQTIETSPAFEEVGTIGRPVNLRLNGGLLWSYGGFTTNITVNYVDSYLNDQGASPASVDSWTTTNLTISYNSEGRFDGWMDDTIFTLSAINLFNQDPPFIDGSHFSRTGVFYDPNAANPRGRMLSFQITKQW